VPAEENKRPAKQEKRQTELYTLRLSFHSHGYHKSTEHSQDKFSNLKS